MGKDLLHSASAIVVVATCNSLYPEFLCAGKSGPPFVESWMISCAMASQIPMWSPAMPVEAGKKSRNRNKENRPVRYETD